MSLHPAEPGPFQKYLFSGACYVSLGECYTRLVELQGRPAVWSEHTELQTRLTDLWQQIFGQHLAVAGTIGGVPPLAALSGLDAEIQAWQAQAFSRVGASMQSLVEMFLSDPQRPPDFPSFFQAWITACDRDWQHLVHTETFSQIIGRVVNDGLLPATAGTAK